MGVTSKNLFVMDLETLALSPAGEVAGSGCVAFASAGGAAGRDGEGHLWHYDLKAKAPSRRAFRLPGGEWSRLIVWARDGKTGLLYTADANGNLFSFDESKGFSASLGRTKPAPVGPMAVTHDGRVFGFCGDGIAKMFCYVPGGEVADLGVAASVIERRRHG